MLHWFEAALLTAPPVAAVTISIAAMLLVGFAVTRLTRLAKLPHVTAYVLAGILIGPDCLNLVPTNVAEGMDFLSDIALAFIAFGAGEYLNAGAWKKSGGKVILITVLEACVASVFVFAAAYYLLHLELAFSMVLAALAAATAPASTLMTIRQTGAKGDFVNTLLRVVVLDDAVGLMEYSIAIAIAVASVLNEGAGTGFSGIIRPILSNLCVWVLGGLFGFLIKLLTPQKRSADNRLILSVGLLFTFCGICAMLSVSPLLGCMIMGSVYANIADSGQLFRQLNSFSPPILLLFFVGSGMSFRFRSLFQSSGGVGAVPLAAIGVLYFFARIIGKYAGAYLGCLLAREPREVRNYLGLALIPQAGVAIGLAAFGARTLGGEAGSALQTIVLASSVLYELIGPGCAKLSLYLSKSYVRPPASPLSCVRKDSHGNKNIL